MATMDALNEILDITAPLTHPRGSRLPLLLWSATDPDTDDPAELEGIIGELNQRGIALITTWNHADPRSMTRALRTGGIQARMGIETCVHVSPVLNRFFDGSPGTGHTNSAGEEYFDHSYDEQIHIGCPFRVDHRIPEIRGRVAGFAGAFLDAGLRPSLVFADWEIDGPIEWNDSWEIAKQCTRCRRKIPDIESFSSYQRAMRGVRARLQRLAYARPLREAFPDVLVTNYGVYPNDGRRYWYDYFERPPRTPQYRPWFHEFPLTDYTAAMPVVYAWDYLYDWHSFENTDYRWFRSMLMVAGNAGAHTPPHIPLIPFVHRNVISVSKPPVESAVELSKPMFRELLWHMLLRGSATLFSWCPAALTRDEVGPIHEVYAASLEYGEFLTRGTPMVFDVPAEPGPVVSVVVLGRQALVRRTDFTDSREPVDVVVGDSTIRVTSGDPGCRIIDL